MTLQQKMHSKKGFTLVELVVVIAILAILAAIAIPAVSGIINSANESQKASDAATVENACKTYYAGIVAGSAVSAEAEEFLQYLESADAAAVFESYGFTMAG